MRYAGVLVFSDDLSRVVLLRKERPEWLTGTWCFPGGHVEQGETDRVAARRELIDETGIKVKMTCLLPLVRLKAVTAPARTVSVFWVRGSHYVEQARTLTEESVKVWECRRFFDSDVENALDAELAPGLDWMILMVRDPLRAGRDWAQVPLDLSDVAS